MQTAGYKNTEAVSPANRAKNLYQLHVNSINESVFEKVSDEIVDQKVYLARLQMLGINTQVVNKGTLLFSAIDQTENGQSGGSVNNSITPLNIHRDIGDYFISCDENDFKADTDGLFVISNHIPRIIPVCNDANVSITISDDSMSVLVDFYPPQNGGKMVSVNEVIEKIIDLNIVADIDEKLIESVLAEMEEKGECKLQVEVAKGNPPIHGKDEYIEYLINVDADKRPIIGEDGSIDFHKINSVVSVEQDQKIAILHAPEKGSSGNDVLGKPIKATDGKKTGFVIGPNLYRSEENREHIYAAADGFLMHSEKSLEVVDTHIVRGDIDFSTGNITCKGSIKVFGNVKYGFELKLSKNIEVMGSVTNAKLEAGENIDIKGGFTGTNQGYIKAGGDISIKYMQNQPLWCRSKLTFQRELLECNTYVAKKILGQGLHSSIIGGYAIAKDSIEAAYIGNEYGAQTRIELGFDYNTKNVIQQKLAKLEKDKKEAEKLNITILKFSSMKRMNDQQYDELKKIAFEYKTLVSNMETLKQEIRELNKEIITPSKATLKVFKTVFPGTKIIINGRHFNVTQPINSKSFMLSAQNEVVVV